VDGVEVPADVHVEHPVPVVQRAVLPEGEQHQAGVVEQDVDGSVGGDCEVGERLDLLAVGDVGGLGYRGAARLADVGRQLVEAVLIAGGEDDVGAAGGERLRGRGTDAGGGAGDDNGLALEVTHGMLPMGVGVGVNAVFWALRAGW
jgi:hypothetical protein